VDNLVGFLELQVMRECKMDRVQLKK